MTASRLPIERAVAIISKRLHWTRTETEALPLSRLMRTFDWVTRG